MRCGPGLSNFTGRPNHLCATQSFALGPLFLKLLEIPGFYYALSQSDLIVIEMETRILSAFPLFQSNNSNTRLLRPVEKFGEHFTIAFVISGNSCCRLKLVFFNLRYFIVNLLQVLVSYRRIECWWPSVNFKKSTRFSSYVSMIMKTARHI